MIKYLFFILLGFAPVLVSAQTNLIIGTVTDAETSQSLRDVQIYWTGHKDDLVRSDKFGVFQIEKITGLTTLVFEMSGKKKVTKNVEIDADHNEINVSLEDMGATSVTASRWEQSVHEIPASTVIISREEIADNGYMTLQEILENVPGLFTVDHRSETGITLGIRGFWSDFNKSVMIQVNGVNMLSERRNDFPFFKINVPVEAIDKIEIVRGPMSVIYGAGAFFGVINIITNSQASEGNSMISTGIGTQRTQQNFVRYSASSGAWNLSFNAMTYRRDGFNEEWNDIVSDSIYNADTDDPNTISISDYKDSSIHRDRYSKIEQAFNLSITHGGFFSNINCAVSDFGFSWSPFKTYWPGPKIRNDFKSFTGNFQMGYGSSFKNIDYQLKATYMKSKVDMDYNFYTDNNFRLSENRSSALRVELNAKAILLQSEKEDGLNIDLIGGYYFNANLENNSFYVTPEFNRQTWYLGLKPGSHVYTNAFYLQPEFKKGRSKFILGARIEKESAYNMLYHQNLNVDPTLYTRLLLEDVKPSNNFFVTPRVAYIYAFKPKRKSHNYVKAMLGRAVKQANVVQNTNDIMVTYYKANDGAYPADTNYLRPETIWTLEMGYTYVNDSTDLEINANLFGNLLESLITRVPTVQNGSFVAYSKNAGKMRTIGAELIVKKKFQIDINKSYPLTLRTDASVTIQKSFLEPTEFDTASISFSPPILSTIRVLGKYNKFSAAINANLVGKMFSYYNETSLDASGQVATPGYYIGDDTKAYVLLGLNLRLQNIHFSKKKEKENNGYYFNLKCSNLINTQYHYPTYTNTSWADRGYLGRARQILFTMGYIF
ncbi:MAG: outer membrane receptor protein involved in Fe transport [Arenicella sp.]|jgi:outer membrane receptor protein involved in Fe transport